MRSETSLSMLLLLGVILFGIFFPPVLFLAPLVFYLLWERFFAEIFSLAPPESRYAYGHARPRSPPA